MLFEEDEDDDEVPEGEAAPAVGEMPAPEEGERVG